MDPFGHESAIIEIRTIANGYAGYKTDLEKIQAINEIAMQWAQCHLNSLRISKKSINYKDEKFKIDRKEKIKIRKHLKTCRIRTCVVCTSMRKDLKREGK